MANRISARDSHAPYQVQVDGVEVDFVIWVDLKRGRVLSHRHPFLIRNGSLVRTFTQGKVELVPL